MPMPMFANRIAGFVLPFALLFAGTARAAIIEQGSFTLHKYKQAIGEERYTVDKSDKGLAIHADFRFKDRGTEVPLQADLHLAADGAPLRLALKGSTARGNEVNLDAQANADGVHIVEDGKARDSAGKAAFLLGSYAPVSFQQQLMRRWIALGRPASMAVLPLGEVRIRQSGSDETGAGTRRRRLARHVVEGLIWGQESVWLDEQGQLVALVGTDAEFDHFEAIRKGDEALLPQLLTASTRDQLQNLGRSYPLPKRDDRTVTAIRGARLIDGSGKPAVPDAVILLKGQRIVAAGPRTRLRIPRGARIVDATGMTVIPGLWDMHAHYNQVEWGPIYLAAGVTTARDMANEFEYILALKRALAAGEGLGPRLFISGLIDGRGEMTLGVDTADTAAEGEALVRRYKQAGFDQIKVYSSIKPEVLKAVIDEAHRQGLRVAGHLPTAVTLPQALAFGMDEITHVNTAYPGFFAPGTVFDRKLPPPKLDLDGPDARAMLAEMARRQVSFDPTLAVLELFMATKEHPVGEVEPGVAMVPPQLAGNFVAAPATPERAARSAALKRQFLEIVLAAEQAGIPVLAGTDQSVPGHSIHRELELYVEAGFTPMQALQAATSVPARVMGQDRDSGTIEAGKRADLLLLDGDPLSDIRNTRRIRTVVAAGRFYAPAPLWKMVGFTPPRDPPASGASAAPAQ